MGKDKQAEPGSCDFSDCEIDMSPSHATTAYRGSPTDGIGTPCIDGMTLSAADVERTAEKVALQQETIRKAVYAIASHVDDAQQCRGLFEMMGIDLASVRAAREVGPEQP